jgi:hypothetical protein
MGVSPMPEFDKGNNHYQIEAHGNLDWAHWADGPFCPHCGEREAMRTIHGQTSRPGIYLCLTCRKRFSGTLDILFQGAKATRPRALPGTAIMARIWRCRQIPMVRMLSYPVWYPIWYCGHIVRQILMGGDPAPPRKN